MGNQCIITGQSIRNIFARNMLCFQVIFPPLGKVIQSPVLGLCACMFEYSHPLCISNIMENTLKDFDEVFGFGLKWFQKVLFKWSRDGSQCRHLQFLMSVCMYVCMRGAWWWWCVCVCVCVVCVFCYVCVCVGVGVGGVGWGGQGVLVSR